MKECKIRRDQNKIIYYLDLEEISLALKNADLLHLKPGIVGKCIVYKAANTES